MPHLKAFPNYGLERELSPPLSAYWEKGDSKCRDRSHLTSHPLANKGQRNVPCFDYKDQTRFWK